MSAALHEHLKTFQEWSVTAYDQFGRGDHRAALMYTRLCGEAACKVILLQRWSPTRAQEAIGGGSMQEMLSTLQRNALVTPPLLSGLHLLRSTGNKAVHGDSFQPSDVQVAMAALRMVAERMYAEVLGLPLPASIQQAFKANDTEERLARANAALRSSMTVRKSKADRPRKEPDPVADPSDDRLRSIEERLEQLLRAQQSISTAAPASAEDRILEPDVAVSTPAKRLMWPWLLAGGGVAAILSIAFVLSRGDASAPARVALVTNADMRVLVLPFTVLQDDPTVSINLHEALRKRLLERAPLWPMRVDLVFDTSASSASRTQAEAIALARGLNAGLVLFGELYEPSAADSGRIELRYADTTRTSSASGTMGPRTFRTIADSAAQRTLTAAVTIVEFRIAAWLINAGRPSQALALLHTTPTVTREGANGVHMLRSYCHRELGELPRAMREVEAVLRDDPDNISANRGMGALLVDNGDKTAAIGFYEKALRRTPDDAGLILDLAYLMGESKDQANFDPPRFKQLMARAMRLDSSRVEVWDLTGQIAKSEGRMADALRAYERAYLIDSNYVQGVHDLGEMLAVYVDTPDYPRAEYLLRRVLAADSSRAHACMLLGQVLNTQQKEPELAARLFRKSQEKDPKWRLVALKGEAEAAYKRKDLTNAARLYEQLVAEDPANHDAMAWLVSIYNDQRNYARSLELMQAMHATDTLRHNYNLNLGTFHRHAPTPWRNLPLAEKYLRRALLTDPDDAYNLSELAMALADQEKEEEAIPCCERALRRNPDDFDCSAFLGRAMQLKKRSKEAQTYYEKALRIRPGDPVVLVGLAGALVDQGPRNHAQALRMLEQAARTSPHEAMLIYNLACFHLEFGDKAAAARYYHQALALDASVQDATVERRLRAAGY